MNTLLSVNINKVATIRNSRGGNVPNLLQFAIDCESFGADGITIHPRPDERHIKYSDVPELKKIVKKELNIEGYPSKDFLQLINETIPTQCTLVPDPPHALTSNQGWQVDQNKLFLQDVVAFLKSKNIRVSLFVDTDLENIKSAAALGVDRIELYTGPYAANFEINKSNNTIIEEYIKAASLAHELGLGINAGHDLNLENLAFFKSNIKHLAEVSIGHAIISDALYYGIKETILKYKKQLL